MQQGVEIYCIMQAEAGVGVVNPKKIMAMVIITTDH